MSEHFLVKFICRSETAWIMLHGQHQTEGLAFFFTVLVVHLKLSKQNL